MGESDLSTELFEACSDLWLLIVSFDFILLVVFLGDTEDFSIAVEFSLAMALTFFSTLSSF